mmetsp:Transcript_769/g.1797  ORF Transcript_769/g.1797 Transcript_769/m.1797 type:complete len:235 (+) Transcript_769:4323-5027(+)
MVALACRFRGFALCLRPMLMTVPCSASHEAAACACSAHTTKPSVPRMLTDWTKGRQASPVPRPRDAANPPRSSCAQPSASAFASRRSGLSVNALCTVVRGGPVTSSTSCVRPSWVLYCFRSWSQSGAESLASCALMSCALASCAPEKSTLVWWDLPCPFFLGPSEAPCSNCSVRSDVLTCLGTSDEVTEGNFSWTERMPAGVPLTSQWSVGTGCKMLIPTLVSMLDTAAFMAGS